jgi:hypothetical protein
MHHGSSDIRDYLEPSRFEKIAMTSLPIGILCHGSKEDQDSRKDEVPQEVHGGVE